MTTTTDMEELKAKLNDIVVDIAFGINDREDLPRYVDQLVALFEERELAARVDENYRAIKSIDSIPLADGNQALKHPGDIATPAINLLHDRIKQLNTPTIEGGDE
jgi:hypothetical protein